MTTDREELQELMRGAPRRFMTARATIREWRDEEVADRLRDRIPGDEVHRRNLHPSDETTTPSRRDEFERIWRVWHEKPNRWRQEIEPAWGDASGTEYRVVDGRRFWYYNPAHGPRHAVAETSNFAPEFEIIHLFDPAVPHLELDELELRASGRARVAGREAIRVEGTKPGGWEHPPEPLWWGADDYELLIDAERGVILRLASRIGGRAFDVAEVLDISFDETLPEGTFVLQLPGVEFLETDYLT